MLSHVLSEINLASSTRRIQIDAPVLTDSRAFFSRLSANGPEQHLEKPSLKLKNAHNKYASSMPCLLNPIGRIVKGQKKSCKCTTAPTGKEQIPTSDQIAAHLRHIVGNLHSPLGERIHRYLLNRSEQLLQATVRLRQERLEPLRIWLA